MTLEQTVEIPASRHISFDLPFTFPVGKAKVEVTITPEQPVMDKAVSTLEPLADIEKYPWESIIGCCKDSGRTVGDFLQDKYRENFIEEVKMAERNNREVPAVVLEMGAKRGFTIEGLKADGLL
ncbi:hypothetical protein AGMMS49546_11010 [Spirochaetia bacterium]|nr:hypothetical protein AGMMS49546_11010 [Spirochaetia bacterium]